MALLIDYVSHHRRPSVPPHALGVALFHIVPTRNPLYSLCTSKSSGRGEKMPCQMIHGTLRRWERTKTGGYPHQASTASLPQAVCARGVINAQITTLVWIRSEGWSAHLILQNRGTRCSRLFSCTSKSMRLPCMTFVVVDHRL